MANWLTCTLIGRFSKVNNKSSPPPHSLPLPPAFYCQAPSPFPVCATGNMERVDGKRQRACKSLYAESSPNGISRKGKRKGKKVVDEAAIYIHCMIALYLRWRKVWMRLVGTLDCHYYLCYTLVASPPPHSPNQQPWGPAIGWRHWRASQWAFKINDWVPTY